MIKAKDYLASEVIAHDDNNSIVVMCNTCVLRDGTPITYFVVIGPKPSDREVFANLNNALAYANKLREE